jgi:nucleoside-diphosphate-sugar epimerase
MMRVVVAGATGAIGKQLVPRLVAADHEVHGMTRSESKQAMLDELRHFDRDFALTQPPAN